MTSFIDWHAHWVPPEVVALLAERDVAPCLLDSPSGRLFDVGPSFTVPVKEAQLDLDLRVREMDAQGIDVQVLSLAVVLGCFLARLPRDLEHAVVEANNRGLANLVRHRGARFQGLAALPVTGLETAPAILEKAVREQGLLGAILPADAFADKERAARYRPVLEVAHRLGAHLFIHPGPIPETAFEPDVADEARLIRRRAVDFQHRLTSAAITFEYTDFLDPYPGLTVHLANLGGTIALLGERIAMTAERMALPKHLSSGRLRRTVLDTASFGAEGIRLAQAVLGEGRLLFGSDSPALALAPACRGVLEAGLAPASVAQIMEGAACKRPSLVARPS